MTTQRRKNIKKLIKIVAIVLVIVALINFVCTPVSNAKVESSLLDACTKIVSTILDGLIGLLFWPFKVLILLLGKGMELILGFFVPGTGKVTIEGILFNKIDVLSIDFMNIDGTTYAPAQLLRQNVSQWYVAVRNLSAAILVIICLYTGIRMALATASDKAKYKEMLINWISSVALLFVLHYVIAGVIAINNVVVQAIGTGLTDASGESMNILSETFFSEAIWSIGFSESTAYSVCYLVLTFMTFTFVIMYLKRLITIAFLIIIAPLVTITYSIDKMGDGKAQGLNNWFKEFLYNIIIQPFHCIAYAALGGMATTLASSSGAGLAEGVACIVIVAFIMKSEKILKTIFHMQSDSMMDALGSAAIASNITNRAMQFGKQVSGSVKQTVKANKANAEEIRKVKDEIKIAKGKTTREQVNKNNAARRDKQKERADKKKAFQQEHPKISGFTRDLLAFQGDANATLFSGATAFSMGLAQGDENAAILSGLRAGEATHKERKKQGQEYKQAALQHNVAKAYNNYREEEIAKITQEFKGNPDFEKMKEKDQTELIERTFDRKVQGLLNKGSITNMDNENELNLVHAMDELQRELESQGLSGDNAMKQVQSVVAKIGRGEMGETIDRDIDFKIGEKEFQLPIGSISDYELGYFEHGRSDTTTEVIERHLGPRTSTSNEGGTPGPSRNKTQSTSDSPNPSGRKPGSGRKQGPAKGYTKVSSGEKHKPLNSPTNKSRQAMNPGSKYTSKGLANQDRRRGNTKGGYGGRKR